MCQSKKRIRELFEPLGEDLGVNEIVSWWERRRFSYNVIVSLAGLVFLIAYEVFWSTSGLLCDADDVIEPMLLPVIVIGLPILWNVCYLLGAFMQALIPKSKAGLRRKSGPVLLKAGLAFSLFILSLPALDAGCGWIYQATRGFPNDHALSKYNDFPVRSTGK